MITLQSWLFRYWGDGNHLPGRILRILKDHQKSTRCIVPARQDALYRSVGKHGRDRGVHPRGFDERSSHGSILNQGVLITRVRVILMTARRRTARQDETR